MLLLDFVIYSIFALAFCSYSQLEQLNQAKRGAVKA